jgi:hypothetical protein
VLPSVNRGNKILHTYTELVYKRARLKKMSTESREIRFVGRVTDIEYTGNASSFS